jgi:hypothetical protein
MSKVFCPKSHLPGIAIPNRDMASVQHLGPMWSLPLHICCVMKVLGATTIES